MNVNNGDKSAQSFGARIASLEFARIAVQESKRGRPAERELHVACIDAEIDFLRRCEPRKHEIAAILGAKR